MGALKALTDDGLFRGQSQEFFNVLTDLATAYFQRAQQEDKKDDFGAAYELLSQALRLRPDDPVALFNRAIVAEHQFLYQQALDQIGLRERNTGPRFPLETASVRCICEDVQIVLF